MLSIRSFAVLGSVIALAACGAPPNADGATTAAEGPESVKSDLLLPPLPLLLNLLYNPSFETPNTGIPLYAPAFAHGWASAPAWAGNTSAALDWPTTNNDGPDFGSIVTWLANDTAPGSAAGSHSILVAANTVDGGIAQQYLVGGTPPLHQQFLVSVKVLSGTVYAGIGNSSWPVSKAVPSTWAYQAAKNNPDVNGAEWETISMCAPEGVGANEVLVYALWDAPAVYYVDNAIVLENSSACP